MSWQEKRGSLGKKENPVKLCVFVLVGGAETL